MHPFSACTLGTLARKAARSSSRRPGLAVMMATTRIIRYSLWLVRLPGQRGQLTSPAPHSPAKRRGAKSRSRQRSRPASAYATLALAFIAPAWFNAVRERSALELLDLV